MNSTWPSPAARSAVSTTFCDARIEARSEAVGRQSTRATGRPNRSRRVPSVTRESGLGACSAWTRMARTLRAGSARRRRARAEGAEVAEAGRDVAQVPEQLGRQRPAPAGLDQRGQRPDRLGREGKVAGEEEERAVEELPSRCAASVTRSAPCTLDPGRGRVDGVEAGAADQFGRSPGRCTRCGPTAARRRTDRPGPGRCRAPGGALGG